MTAITINDVIDYVLNTYPGVVIGQNWGERVLFYNPDNRFPKGVYLLSFKEKDGPNDSASNLSRPGVYRLNIGISRETFTTLFGPIPARPPAGGVVATGHDFQQLDQIMPHPVYGWMAWIGVLNPGPATFETLKPLIDEGYRLAVKKFKKRARKSANT
jgi:hypothetical protein